MKKNTKQNTYCVTMCTVHTDSLYAGNYS